MIRFTSKCWQCNGMGGSFSGPCHDCFGQGEIPDAAATLDAYEAREPLVQEVIRLARQKYEPGFNPEAARLQLAKAAVKLAEWKP